MIMGEKLEELNRDLSETTAHSFPEEYVRKTLMAHGFFTHTKLLDEHKKQLKKIEERNLLKTQKSLDGITDEDKRRTTQLVYHFREGKEFHSLREPLDLQKRILSIRNLPLWPAEVPCIVHHTRLIFDQPPSPEPLYIQDFPIVSPKIRSINGEGCVVYNNSPGSQKHFTHSRAGPSIPETQSQQRRNINDNLIFESRFECGNLAKAVRVGRWDYELYLRHDLYTQKHTQWFYFSVQNMRAGQTYRFTIINLYKPSSLYNEGMQPLMYSDKKGNMMGVGWRRVGFNIKYFKTDIRRVDTRAETYYYSLTWSYTFTYDDDVCYFAHCYPYTFSDLQEYLHVISNDPVKSSFCKQRTLCHTIAGNPVPLLTITSPSVSPDEAQTKRCIVVSARVHPGETNGSWMMKGLLDFLISDSSDAQILRDVFVFKIIPMLNPDGVIVGNYRCSLSGRDLNRNYKTNLREAYPTVWHTKQLIRKISEEREVVLYCDLHGHSRKQNVFIYGCDKIQDPSVRLRSRVFPKMLSLNAPNKFSYKGCNFKVQKNKVGTGRVFMWNEIGIINSFTMEATFCGSNLGKGSGYHFSTKEFEMMGYHFCDTLLDYCDPDHTKVDYILTQLTEEYRQILLDKLASVGVSVPVGVDPLDMEFDSDFLSDLDSSDNGSDSSESDGGAPIYIVDKSGKKKKRKQLPTRKERNRHKAQLKLSHKLNQTAIHNTKTEVLPDNDPVINDNNKKMVSNGTRSTDQLLTAGGSMNGGIPKYVQERIDERQRKDSIHSFNRPQDDESEYVEIVTADYLRNGLPQNNALEATKELIASTASLLSRPKDCPMAISSMILQQPSQTRVTSKHHLPQLPTSTSTVMSHVVGPSSVDNGVFTSNYVVNHLHETSDDTAPHHLIRGSSSNTRNLMSLSKLFRQLKPQILNSVTCPQRGSSPTDRQGHRINSSSHLYQTHSQTQPKLEYVGFNGDPISQREYSRPLTPVTFPHQRLVNIKSTKPDSSILIEKRHTVFSEIVSDKTTDHLDKACSSPKLPVPKTRLTNFDHKVVDDIRTSYNDIIDNTSSKRSFNENERASPSQELESSRTNGDPSYLKLVQPPTTLLKLPIKDDKIVISKQDNVQLQSTVPKSVSTPEYTKQKREREKGGGGGRVLAGRGGTNVEIHKQEVANTVESLQHMRKLFKGMDDIPANTTKVSKRPHTSLSFPPVTSRSHDLTNSVKRNVYTSEGERKRMKGTAKNDNIPQWKIYSSKPKNSVTPRSFTEKSPATVSLMLPGRVHPPNPPSSTKPLHTRYYSNYHKGIFKN